MIWVINPLFVASDRVSAFDVILPQGIPHKGEILIMIALIRLIKQLILLVIIL